MRNNFPQPLIVHKNLLIQLKCALIIFFPVSSAHAQDWGFQPRVSAGFMYYEYESENLFFSESYVETGVFDDGNATPFTIEGKQSLSAGSYKIDDTLPTVGIGGTVFYRRFFLDAYLQHAYSGESSYTQNRSLLIDSELNAERTSGPNTINTRSNGFSVGEYFRETNVDFDRTEYAISFGLNVTDNLLVYAGYKSTETAFERVINEDGTFTITQEIQTFINGELTDTRNFTEVTNDPGSFRSKSKLKQNGPFIGMGYGWPITETGVLSTNLAIAFMDAEEDNSFTFGSTNLAPEFNNRTTTSNFDGDVVGLTLGIQWIDSLTDRFSYSVGASGYQYSFESNSSRASNVTETVINFNASLIYRF